LEAERQELLRRRLFRIFLTPELDKVPDAEREKETAVAWERFKRVPLG
jgi:hypothetical protein